MVTQRIPWADESIGKVAVLHAKAGDVKRAFQIVNGIKYPEIRAETLARIALVQALAGEAAASKSTFQHALEAVPTLLGHEEDWDFANIAALQAKAGDMQGAFHTVQAIKQPHMRAQALTKIALVQVAAESVWVARSTLERADQTTAAIGNDPQVLAYALLSIGRAQTKVADRVGARLTLQRAVQAAASIGYPHTKAVAMADIAEAQAELGEAATARLTLTQALQATDALRGVPGGLRGDALGRIAQAQARTGDIEGALRTVKAITGFAPSDKGDALLVIARVQAEGGDVKAALQTAAS